jgi:UDP-glucuronate decarboxylase
MSKDILNQDAEYICSRVNLNELSGKTILITGASGLLGIHLLASLKYYLKTTDSFCKVIAVIYSPLDDYQREVMDFPGLEIYSGDITEVDFCRSLPFADYIIHAAGYGQPGKFMDNPDKTLKLNTLSTFLLFEKLTNGGKFLFLSSSEVYSGLKSNNYEESQIGLTNTTHPRACYIEGKRSGEAICNAYRFKGVKAYSARLAHTYGPGARKGDRRVILALIEKGIKGKIELLDKGEMVRTYCYVADAVEMMWNILLSGTEPIYNVGGFSKTTIAEMAKMIGEYMNVPVLFPEKLNEVAGAPEDVNLNLSKVRNEFKKSDFISLNEGLIRTIEWYKRIK